MGIASVSDPAMLPVKICCIQDEAEARLAVECGARALGLVSSMPSGWGPIPDERIRQIAATVPPFVSTVLLSSRTTVPGVIEHVDACGCDTLQLVDEFPVAGYDFLRARFPHLRILKAVHVVDESSIQDAIDLAPHVDAVLLDTGSPHAEVKVLGGTGKTHDWSISARIVDALAPHPVILAGGLKPNNIAEAVRRVKPYALDLCTGARTDTALDPAKLRALFAALP